MCKWWSNLCKFYSELRSEILNENFEDLINYLYTIKLIFHKTTQKIILKINGQSEFCVYNQNPSKTHLQFFTQSLTQILLFVCIYRDSHTLHL